MNNLPETQQAAPAWSDRSASIAKLAAALSKAQASIEAAKKDSINPHFRSKYADLSSVWAAIREPLTSNDLAVVQEPGASNGKLLLTTTLLHSSGEYIRSSFEIPVTKQDPQGFGSAITYARRYALQAVVGIAPEDDDGNAASQGSHTDYREEARTQPGRQPQPITQKGQGGEYVIKLHPKQTDERAIVKAAGYRWDKEAQVWRGSQPIAELEQYQVGGAQQESEDAPPFDYDENDIREYEG